MRTTGESSAHVMIAAAILIAAALSVGATAQGATRSSRRSDIGEGHPEASPYSVSFPPLACPVENRRRPADTLGNQPMQVYIAV
jgi:hypothetical protein